MISTAGVEGFVVCVGGHSRAEVLRLLHSADVRLNVHAETLLAHPVFDNPERQDLRIVERTVEELGFERGAIQSRVFSAAKNQGLALCPVVAGPYLRMAMMSQPDAPDSVLSAGRAPTGAIHVASAPLRGDVEYPKGFYLRVVDGLAWLRGYRCDDTYVWAPDHRLVFLSPNR